MKKIAVVEDNPDNRALVQALLDEFYEIIEYEQGSDALAGFTEEKPDLILLDISLPGMDGTEVLQKIRSDDALRALPVIALTAHAMSGDRDRFLTAGFDDYITKPILDESILIRVIEDQLGNR